MLEMGPGLEWLGVDGIGLNWHGAWAELGRNCNIIKRWIGVARDGLGWIGMDWDGLGGARLTLDQLG